MALRQDPLRLKAYDALNRVITGRVKDTQNWMAAATATSTYQYDEISRLTAESQAIAEGTAH